MCQTSASNTVLFLMHFRVGGPAALALFVPLRTRLVLLFLIWYLKILSAQYASQLVKASLSVPGQAAGGQNSFHSCFLLKPLFILYLNKQKLKFFSYIFLRQKNTLSVRKARGQISLTPIINALFYCCVLMC